MTSTRIVSLQPQTNELFLLPENETDYDNPSERFVNQVNTVRFLSKMRSFINQHNRQIGAIFHGNPCSTFFLGYKIEKYLDNDATLPIQTYYTNDINFYDTQIKYGRKYIYKTKALVGILGSSYSYSNLFVSKNETEMASQTGEIPETHPPNFDEIGSRKYRAYVDVEATPSFQVLEYLVDEHEVAFVDTRTLPPQVEFYNDSNKSSVEFFFSPIFSNINPMPTSQNQNVLPNPFRPLTESDDQIDPLIQITGDMSANPDYFTGIYEIYRMSSPPEQERDFSDNFLTVVDDRTSLVYPESMGSLPPFGTDNMNGHFADSIVPNTKYYYAFRALTYHGTPSNLTMPFEVELLRSSEGYSVSVSQYKYPTDLSTELSKNMKRIMMLYPNLDRLLISDVVENGSAPPTYVIGNGEVLRKNLPTKIKIRVTSKHTGKKVDINLNLILNEDDSFN